MRDDLRAALSSLRSPNGFTIPALIVLTLGIGVLALRAIVAEAVLGGLADYAARPADIALDVESRQLTDLLVADLDTARVDGVRPGARRISTWRESV
jgi:hypothetical protein